MMRRRLTAHPEGMGSMLRLTDGASMRGTIFNLSNAMIGGGILGLPFAVGVFGVPVGLALIAVIGACSDATCFMILYCVDYTREGSYAMVAEVLLGRSFGIIVDLIVLINIIGCCTSYMDIIGDLVPSFLQFMEAPLVIQDRSHTIYFITVCVLLPLSSMRSMGALRYVSLVCLGIIAALIGILVSMGCGIIDVSEPTDRPVALVGQDVSGMIQQLPVVLFAYSCHMNVPILYKELRNSTFEEIGSKFLNKRAKMMRAMNISFIFVIVIYCVGAGAACFAFKDRIATDFLLNFDARRFWLSPYVKVAYSLAIICSYPVMCFSGCQSLHRLIWQCLSLFQSGGTSGLESPLLDSSPAATFKRMMSGEESDLAMMSPLPSPVYCPLMSPVPNFPGCGPDSDERGTASLEITLIEDDSHNSCAESYCDPKFEQAYLSERFLACRKAESREVIDSRKARTEAPVASRKAQLMEVCILVGLNTVLCLAIPDVSTVFGLTGSLSCSALMFSFPGLFFLKVKRLEHAAAGRAGVSLGVIAGYGMLTFGLLVGIVCTSLILSQ